MHCNKLLLCVAVVLGLLAHPLAAATIEVSISSQAAGQVLVSPGSVVLFDVTVKLSDTSNEGLSLFYIDLEFDGGLIEPIAEPTAPPLIHFISPAGVSNPEGYGGVFVDGRLRQIGGAQNTLKLSGPSPIPSGTVIIGVGHVPIVVASGVVQAPDEPGDYSLRVAKALARVIQSGEDGSGAFWDTEWAFAGSLQPLTITVRACEEACADADANGIRDDACTWYDCDNEICSLQPSLFGDVGGAFGDCTPDGFVNLFDRSHVLTCFAGTNPCMGFNLDVGGPFGDCAPDGFCNLFDVSHVLTSFSGTNPCSCPMPAWTPAGVHSVISIPPYGNRGGSR